MLLTLWRRAPLWRLSLSASVAFTALAVMFPPPDRHAAPATSFTPSPDREPNGLAALASPPPGAAREGVVPYAGQQLPLPAGQWRLVVIGRDEGAHAKQLMVMARVRGKQFGGLLVAMGPDTASQASGILQTPEVCSAPEVLAGETAPAAGQNPFLHECWTLTATRPQAMMARDPNAGGVMHRASAQVAALGAAMPDRLLVMHYIRSTEFGWFLMELYLPVRSQAAAPDRAMVAWAKKYAALLHRGYDGSLPAGSSTPVLPHDSG